MTPNHDMIRDPHLAVIEHVHRLQKNNRVPGRFCLPLRGGQDGGEVAGHRDDESV